MTTIDKRYDVFISYAHKDNLKEFLAEHGISLPQEYESETP